MSLESKPEDLAKILAALDRCVHGRHSQDKCNGCYGQSTGNLLLPAGTRIGTDLRGSPIVVPAPELLRIASHWLPKEFRSKLYDLGPV